MLLLLLLALLALPVLACCCCKLQLPVLRLPGHCLLQVPLLSAAAA